MTNQILKFEIPIDDEPHVLVLTHRLKVISCGFDPADDDDETFCLWYIHGRANELDPEDPEDTYPEQIFQVYSTGMYVPDGGYSVGSDADSTGVVWHLFDTTNLEE